VIGCHGHAATAIEGPRVTAREATTEPTMPGFSGALIPLFKHRRFGVVCRSYPVLVSDDYLTLPIDAESATAMNERTLRFALVDTSSVEAFGPWYTAMARGFLEKRPSEKIIEYQRETATTRRQSGVWDETAADAASPIATIASWPTDLTVPGHTSVPAWAISAVTVSGTHRRRGIARAMLTAELRTAKALGIPVAILTVSEATIYGRWGFGPAAMTADWTIDPGRTVWAGPAASGRVHNVELAELLAVGPELVEGVRLQTPGQIEFHGVLWERLLGVGDEDFAKRARFLLYTDADGAHQGFAVYQVLDQTTPSERAIVDVKYLVAATDDAGAGLWRHLVEMDLVGELRAALRPTEEPVQWQLSDYRAAEKSHERDHLWTRIVDVPAALIARRYHSPAHLVLDVSDPLGFAAGRFLLTVSSDGTAVVGVLEGDIPDDADAVSLGVRELSSIYLGGVSPVTLARAGRIVELTPGAAAVVERSFRATTTPWLSIWF
jgi:predicted acetyltransferase